MRLKLSLLAIILAAAIIGIPWYLDARIPRATAVVEIHPGIIPPKSGSFSRGSQDNLFETIVAPDTLRLALKQLHSEADERTALTDTLINDLRDKISAKPRRGTDFIEITVKDQSKEKAAQIANAVAIAFVHRRNQSERARARRALEALDDELKTQEALVKQHREELIPLTGSYGIPHFDQNQPLPVPQEGSPKPDKPELSSEKYNQAKEAYDQSRLMLREMIIKQKEARLLLLTPHSPITIHEPAQ